MEFDSEDIDADSSCDDDNVSWVGDSVVVIEPLEAIADRAASRRRSIYC